MRNLLIGAAFSLLVLAVGAAGTACNPNYCADHVDNDCRAPLIDEGSGCVDSADCGDSQGASVCKVETGTCVQCTTEDKTACGGKTPECGVATNLCQACTLHSSCASDACLPNGACGDESDVAYVVSNGGSDAAACGKGSPCSSLAKALTTRRPYIRVNGELRENVRLENTTVTILGGAGSAIRSNQNDTNVVEVRGNSQVELSNLEISGGAPANATSDKGNGIRVEGTQAKLSLLRVTVIDNQGIGLSAQDGTVKIVQSKFLANKNGAISLTKSLFEISNNIIAKNGFSQEGMPVPGSAFGGIYLAQIAMPGNRIEFNTIAENIAPDGTNSGIICSGGNQQIATTNNIVYGNLSGQAFQKQVDGARCTPTYSLVGPFTQSGMGNKAMDPQFVDVGNGNYHLQPTSPAKDAADPMATQDKDVDDDKRDERRDIGADELMN